MQGRSAGGAWLGAGCSAKDHNDAAPASLETGRAPRPEAQPPAPVGGPGAVAHPPAVTVPFGPPSMTLAGAGKRSVSTMRYVYLGDKLTRPELRGQPCDPIRRPDGRCIVGQGKALVCFADGTLCIVLRRRLRLRKERADLHFRRPAPPRDS